MEIFRSLATDSEVADSGRSESLSVGDPAPSLRLKLSSCCLLHAHLWLCTVKLESIDALKRSSQAQALVFRTSSWLWIRVLFPKPLVTQMAPPWTYRDVPFQAQDLGFQSWSQKLVLFHFFFSFFFWCRVKWSRQPT
jgi:hypothetical protein